MPRSVGPPMYGVVWNSDYGVGITQARRVARTYTYPRGWQGEGLERKDVHALLLEEPALQRLGKIFDILGRYVLEENFGLVGRGGRRSLEFLDRRGEANGRRIGTMVLPRLEAGGDRFGRIVDII